MGSLMNDIYEKSSFIFFWYSSYNYNKIYRVNIFSTKAREPSWQCRWGYDISYVCYLFSHTRGPTSSLYEVYYCITNRYYNYI